MTFKNLSLHPDILKAVAELGYEKPTQIQQDVIPKIKEGFDVRASARTGTGKTAAFLLPILDQLRKNPARKKNAARVLILVPTRELGVQITQQLDNYGKYASNAKAVNIGGGVPYHAQLRQLSRPHEVIIATPGRLIDLVNRKKINLSGLETLVLDEADRMLDMGFIDDVKQIIASTPATRQTLLFSATLQGKVVKLSEELQNNPIEVAAASEEQERKNIDQKLHFVDDIHHKNRLLDHLLQDDTIGNAVVFTATKRQADQLVDECRESGLHAAALHGDMNQRMRNQTLARFRKGSVKILIATDVAARGLDVPSITHVINFDLPNSAEDYVHRIGRTGRAGAHGTALSFVAGRDKPLVKRIEQFTGQSIAIMQIAGFEARAISRAPKKQRVQRRFKRFRKAG